jgi:hypothetical protein
VKDMDLDELRASVLADLARIFPDYEFVRTKRTMVLTAPDEAA